MPYEIATLQNSSNFPGNPKPTICIKVTDKEWDAAYKNWKNGKKPTDSKEWGKVVIVTFTLITEKNNE